MAPQQCIVEVVGSHRVVWPGTPQQLLIMTGAARSLLTALGVPRSDKEKKKSNDCAPKIRDWYFMELGIHLFSYVRGRGGMGVGRVGGKLSGGFWEHRH